MPLPTLISSRTNAIAPGNLAIKGPRPWVDAEAFPGADVGAQIMAADAFLGSLAGEIHVFSPGTITTPVVLSHAQRVVRFGPGRWTTSCPSNPVFTLNANQTAIIGAGRSTQFYHTVTTQTIVKMAAFSYLTVQGMWLFRPDAAAASSGAHGIDASGVLAAGCLIDDVVIDRGDRGIVLGATDFSFVRNCVVETCAREGIVVLMDPAVGVCQWDLTHVLSQSNGGDNYAVISSGSGTGSLGTWTDVNSYGGSGYGMAFYGTSGSPITAVRVNGAFLGNEALGAIYLDTYGSNHHISDFYIEAASGPAAVDITANNHHVVLRPAEVTGSEKNGIRSAGDEIQIIGGNIRNNGQNGAAAAAERSGVRVTTGTTRVIGATITNLAATTPQQYGVYSDVATISVVGNTMGGNTTADIAGSVSLDAAIIAANTPLTANAVGANRSHLLTATHVLGGGSAPSIAAGAGAGTGPTVAIAGTDTAGVITVTAGTTPSTSSTIVTVTFAKAFTAAPHVIITPANALTAVLNTTVNVPYTSVGLSSFPLNSAGTALANGSAYAWNYLVIG